MILVLKKSEVKFLHCWHHGVIVWTCFFFMKLNVTWFLAGVIWNTAVHTVMYFYYFLTSYGIKPTWGQSLTTLQMIQFITGGMSFWPMLYFCSYESLKGWLLMYIANQLMLINFLWMFSSFFITKYLGGKKQLIKNE